LYGWLAWRIAPGSSFPRWLLVALAWPAVEYVRTYAFTGFPWNLLAASIVDYTSFIQFDRAAAAEHLAGDALERREPPRDLSAHDGDDERSDSWRRASRDLAGVDRSALLQQHRVLQEHDRERLA